MKSIVFITDRFCEDDRPARLVPRGSNVHLLHVLSCLKQLGVNVRVIQMGERGDCLKLNGIVVYQLYSRSLIEFREQWPECVKPSELVHLNNIDCCCDRNLGWISATIHTNAFIESEAARSDFQRYMQYITEAMVINRAYLRAFPEYRARLRLIRNGIDPLIFPFHRPVPPRQGEKVRVFFPNIPSPKKSLDTALHAITLLNETQHKFVFELRIAGDRPTDLKNGVARSTEFVFLGDLAYPVGMLKQYYQSHIVVIPSKSEACSLAALESMSCGIPVVAADIPGLNETVLSGISGILVSSHSCSAWAEAILRLCEDQQLYLKLSENAQQIVSRDFTLSKMMCEYSTLFRLHKTEPFVYE